MVSKYAAGHFVEVNLEPRLRLQTDNRGAFVLRELHIRAFNHLAFFIGKPTGVGLPDRLVWTHMYR
jgi:hypothetical protein